MHVPRYILLGHRGSPHQAAENTIESFHKAMEAGAAGFEFDVRRSRDGALVVIHDPRTPSVRITGRRPPRLSVARSSSAALGLPLLEDVLRTFRTAWLDIEIKVPGIERPVIELAHRYLDPSRFVITSFRAGSVREIKRLSPATPAGWLFKRTLLTLPRWIAAPEKFGLPPIEYLCPHHSVLTRHLVKLASQRGLGLITWTVNTPAALRRVRERGANVVITNFPDRFARLK
jgi:glycerophosphoryl diester phosphodiesterase